jgi:hypothetical protein
MGFAGRSCGLGLGHLLRLPSNWMRHILLQQSHPLLDIGPRDLLATEWSSQYKLLECSVVAGFEIFPCT